jgi:phage-related protein
MAGVLVDLNITISVPVLDKLTLSSSEVRRLTTEYLLEFKFACFYVPYRYGVVRKLN